MINAKYYLPSEGQIHKACYKALHLEGNVFLELITNIHLEILYH